MAEPRSSASQSSVSTGKRGVPVAAQPQQPAAGTSRSAFAAKLTTTERQAARRAVFRAKRKLALGALKKAAALSYMAIYRATPLERIDLIRRGIPASEAKRILGDLTFGQGVGIKALNLSVATVNKKARAGEALSSEESERVVGFARLVGQLEAMIQEAGVLAGFDALAWMGRWLTEPLPAFGGTRPVDLMDTMEGQGLVSAALAQVHSGAYA